MKNFFPSFMLAMAIAAMSASPVSAQQRHNGSTNGGRSGNRAEQRTERVSRTSSRNDNGSKGSGRPGLSGGNSNSGAGATNQRPQAVINNHHNNGNHNGNNGNNGNHNRPNAGNNGNHNNGNHNGWSNGNHNNGNHNGWNNGNHNNNGNRPGVSTGGHRPNVAPAPRPVQVRPPQRPYRPVMVRPVARPLPPPSWRPRAGVPVIRGILGLTFGVAINASLDYLYNSGYSVDGYGNDIVYLRNVPALNYVWTDGALYYGAGGLDASSFYYSTPYYDLSRYNNVYRNLVATYGSPVSTGNASGIMTSTWFGGNNGYISLSFGAGSGGRYLTTLTMGM